jgi:hypothetical protein
MKGGKREGAGRKPSLESATKLATIKMTPPQHTRFLDLGGSRWVKRLIDETRSPDAPGKVQKAINIALEAA